MYFIKVKIEDCIWLFFINLTNGIIDARNKLIIGKNLIDLDAEENKWLHKYENKINDTPNTDTKKMSKD